MNPYKVLEIDENATTEQIKEAYRRLVKKYHPDKYVDNPLSSLAEEKMREINQAYDMLTGNGAPRRVGLFLVIFGKLQYGWGIFY